MPIATHTFGLLFGGLALLGSLYTLAAAFAAIRFKMGAPDRCAPLPATILKPLKSAEAGLEDCLARLYAQDTVATVQIVFGVADAGDPAVAIVRDVIADHPDCDSTLVIDGTIHGANRKVSNLMNMVPSAKHRVLVISDSDILVPTGWLRTILSELQAPSVGAVTCLYSGKALTGFWSKLAALGISYQFLPNAILGSALGMAQPCTGATIALRRETLDSIGGMARFTDELADDYEIGRAIRARGLSVALSSVIVGHTCAERSFSEWWQHELRWARTIRMIDPAGYVGSLITQPLPLALLALLLLGPVNPALAILVLAFLSRLFLKLATDRRVKEGAGPFWLLPLRDILWFGVFIVSFLGTLVRWREMQFEASQRATQRS